MCRVMFAIVAIAVSGCASLNPNLKLVPASSTFSQLGATVLSPNEAGWSVVQSSATGMAFGRAYTEQGHTAIANTTVFRVDGFGSDDDFLGYIAEQRVKNDDKTRFKILENKSARVTFKTAPCIRYTSLSEDHRHQGVESANFDYLKTTGYVCRHPANGNVAFQMEVSHRSGSKEFPPELISVGEHWFDDIEFNDAGL